mmetsp:Transcript_439/g.1501  ORF Transcript_439/g.1501 Transcript_439/m.1501 type:complete len:248 (-) Transcript_439:46-789(-)
MLTVPAQIKLVDRMLGKRPPSALGEQCKLALHLDSPLKRILEGAVLGHAKIARGNTTNPPRLIVQELGGSESRIDLYSHLLCPGSEPTCELRQGDHVVALVVHRRRNRQAQGEVSEHVVKLVVNTRLNLHRTLRVLSPVRNQLVQTPRFHDVSGEHVCSDFRALLQHTNGDVPAALLRILLQPNRRAQSRRPCSHHNHIVASHGLPRRQLLATGAAQGTSSSEHPPLKPAAPAQRPPQSVHRPHVAL